MLIRTKLLLSYVAMIVVPVVLIGVTAALAYGAYMRDLTPGAVEETSQQHSIPFTELRDLFGGRNELASGLRFIAKHDPRLFSDSAFIKETESELAKVDAGILLLSGDSVVNYISPGLSEADIVAQLNKGSKQYQPAIRHPGPSNGRFNHSLDRISYIDPSGESGTLVIVSDMEPVARFFRRFMPTVLITLFGALVLTNGVLTYFVSRSFIKPLYALKAAAGQIREGHLDRPVHLQRQDEIGQLGLAFEEMRIRLKDSIGDQLQLETNRKELLANISHDLKTPITAIQGCVECLQDGIADSEEKRQKYVTMIANKTTDMNRMIEELLLYSTLDIGKLPFHFETMDIAAFLQQIVDELRHNPRMSDVDVSYSRSSSSVGSSNEHLLIQADQEKLHRAMLNIVDNSLKHMVIQPGMLHFELTNDSSGAVTIRVTDNGSGIPEAALPYVFDQFFRAEQARRSDAGSSGLGLAIVKQIIEGHGGSVIALSTQSAGTSIVITFPALPSAPTKKGVQL